jgi:hypothetical protein
MAGTSSLGDAGGKLPSEEAILSAIEQLRISVLARLDRLEAILASNPDLSPPAEITAHVQNVGDVEGSFGDWIGERRSRRWIEGLKITAPHGIGPEELLCRVVVGFVNDGTDDLCPSHAWLALCRPMHELAPGPLLIHGIEFRPGHRWTYHRDRPEAGTWEIQRLLRDQAAVEFVRDAEETHHRMVATVRDDRTIREYLDAAPDGWTFAKMAASIG